MTTLLKNAKIYDGAGSEPFLGSVLIDGDRIVQVGEQIPGEFDRTIDLEGLSLAPGFIDSHSHNDWFALKNEPLRYFEPFIRQGISSFVCGNCGVSAVGYEDDCPHMDVIGSGLFTFDDTRGQYGSVGAVLDAVDGRMPCNMALLIGHGTARAAASGKVNRKLAPEEETHMLSLLEEGLKQGAAGVSLGLMYVPGLYADVEELKKVAALCVKYDKPLTVHPRAESKVSMAYPQLFGRSHLLRAFDELVEIAKGTKLKLQYSHAIFVGKTSLGAKDELLRMMNDLRHQGVDVMFDIYNECLGVSVITVILPAWYQSMTPEERKKPITRLKLAYLVRASSLLLGFTFDDIQVAYIGEGFERFEGKTVREVAQMEGLSELNAYLMLCEASSFKGRVNMGPYSTPQIISEFEHNPLCLYMTDAWVEDKGVQNPAIYDCYPKFLRDALLGTGDTLPNTIHRMTGAIARRYMLKDRGFVQPGCYADLTVFNEAKIKSAQPDQQRSFGIERLFINGVQVLNGDALNEEALKTSGRAMRT